MKYMFPLIKHIDDVLPHIDDNFIISDKKTYTVINYIISDNETFPNENDLKSNIRRECRGLIFSNSTGKIIRRPLHKFFNCNEREETNVNQVDWEQPHVVMDKLDGSQIAPFKDDTGAIIWGTKMGDTDVAAQVKNYVEQHPKYKNFAHLYIDSGFTPIFEWVSPQQRIVLGYPQDQLILIACRNTCTGYYADYKSLKLIGKEIYDIPVVEIWESSLEDGKHHSFIDELSKKEDIEGVVIRFYNGHMIKVKTEWYVRLHKNKEKVATERNVVDLIVNNQVDDVLPFLMENDKQKLITYEINFRFTVNMFILNHLNIFNEVKDMSRKEFALSNDERFNQFTKGIIFKLMDKPDLNLMEYTINLIKDHCSNNKRFDKIKQNILKGVKYE